jgi:hypothetical protein
MSPQCVHEPLINVTRGQKKTHWNSLALNIWFRVDIIACISVISEQFRYCGVLPKSLNI